MAYAYALNMQDLGQQITSKHCILTYEDKYTIFVYQNIITLKY
jgi:hypothetical protein